MKATLIQIAILEDKIFNETATMDEEVVYRNLIQEIEEMINKG